uniref:CASTOR1 N-terminal domain-containing protein n=1 Tax=Seriola dumerili TaxID=41447 RepID=A0A3B4VS88_SERDU
MELHILEHSLKVASIEKEGIQICTHGLIKLAFVASKTRCKFFSLTETPEDYTINITLIVQKVHLNPFGL